MVPLPVSGDVELIWQQVDRRGKHFELRAGAAVYITLDLPKVWNSTATARTAEGVWEFQRVGFFRPHLLIRAAGTSDSIATFVGIGHGKSQLAMSEGPVVTWHPARGQSKRWIFMGEDEQPVMIFTDVSKRPSLYQFTVHIVALSPHETRGTLLAALGMYLIVDAVTAAMIAATT